MAKEQRVSKKWIIDDAKSNLYQGLGLGGMALACLTAGKLIMKEPVSEYLLTFSLLCGVGTIAELANGIVSLQTGKIMKPNYDSLASNTIATKFLVAGADLSAGATVAGGVEFFRSLAMNDLGAAGVWFATIPIMTGLAGFFWSNAKQVLRK